MARGDSDSEKLAKNVKRLNDLVSGDISYFSFGFSECGYQSQCVGRRSIPGEIENWHAYTNAGRVYLINSAEREIPEVVKIDRTVGINNINFYSSDSSSGREWKFNPVFLTLALAGKYAQKGPWHLFYDIRELREPAFDWRMTMGGRMDYVSLKSSLFVLPGIANLKRFFDIRKEIMEKEPEFITKEELHQESERDHAYIVAEKVRNPKKTSPSDSDIFDKFGFPPFIRELGGGFHINFSPTLPIEAEMAESVRKISDNSQLVLPFKSQSPAQSPALST